MPRTPALLALPLLALALAGCAVEPPRVEYGPGDPRNPAPGEAPAGTGGNAGAAAGAGGNASADFSAPPPWEVRQWWRYRSPNGDDTRAVAADLGSAWQVGTSSETIAYFDARVDIATIGPIRKADLAGAQRGTAVEYFRWPLEANATWATPWDGTQRTVRVLGPATASVGGRTYPAMALEAREGDRVALRYDFVPAAGWYSRLEFFGPDGSTFVIALQDFGRGYNGTLVEARLTPLHAESGNGPLTPASQFDVPAGQAYLDVRGLLRGDAAAYEFGFRGPDGAQTGFQVGPCTANCTLPFNATLPATPGTWGLLAAGAVQGQQVRPHAELSITAVQHLRRNLGQ